LVFTREDGSLVQPDHVSDSFDRIVRQSGLPRLTVHGLRHTHATILLAKGVPVKVVSERLGQATSQITLNIYTHVMPGMQAQAVERCSPKPWRGSDALWSRRHGYFCRDGRPLISFATQLPKQVREIDAPQVGRCVDFHREIHGIVWSNALWPVGTVEQTGLNDLAELNSVRGARTQRDRI